MRSSWAYKVCSAERGGDWEVPSLLTTTSSWGGTEREVLTSLVSSKRMCGNGLKQHQGKLRLDIRKNIFPHWGWTSTGTSSPVKWLCPQACQCSRGVWTKLLDIWFNLDCPVWSQELRLDYPCGSLPNSGYSVFHKI